MNTLVEFLRDPAALRRVAADAAVLVDIEVRGKGGLSGMALKAGYKSVKAMRPSMMEDALVHLLPEFAPVLDEHYAKGQASGDLAAYFRAHSTAIADGLLVVTDRKASRAKNAVLKKIYDGLRSTAQRHTAEAVPSLVGLIRKHLPS